jgi:hypothetical protein
MKRIYGAFLSLYPREYRDLFGPEVLDVFAQAASEHRARGWHVWVWFLVTELSGAVTSAAGHWIDRFAARRHAPVPEVSGANAQTRVDLNLKRMTQAIAKRDFTSARTYSFEERRAREELRKLRDRYGFDND